MYPDTPAQDTWLGGRRKQCFILKFSLPYRYLLRFTEVLVVLLFKKKKNTFALSNALKSEEYMYSCSTAAKGFVLRALINNAYVHVHVLSSTTCTCSNAALVNLVYTTESRSSKIEKVFQLFILYFEGCF